MAASDVDTNRGRVRRWFAIWCVVAHLSFAFCFLSYVAMLYEIETVLVTGWAVAALGLLLLTAGVFARYAAVVWIGLANGVVCAVFVGCVQIFGWGPDAAYVPFALMGVAFLIGLLLLLFHARRTMRRVDPNRCVRCGYLLIRLPEPRCPECGTPFDPTTIRDAADGAAGAE
jgi:hypothetical protein